MMDATGPVYSFKNRVTKECLVFRENLVTKRALVRYTDCTQQNAWRGRADMGSLAAYINLQSVLDAADPLGGTARRDRNNLNTLMKMPSPARIATEDFRRG